MQDEEVEGVPGLTVKERIKKELQDRVMVFFLGLFSGIGGCTIILLLAKYGVI